jgi:hypothetical protein
MINCGMGLWVDLLQCVYTSLLGVYFLPVLRGSPRKKFPSLPIPALTKAWFFVRAVITPKTTEIRLVIRSIEFSQNLQGYVTNRTEHGFALDQDPDPKRQHECMVVGVKSTRSAIIHRQNRGQPLPRPGLRKLLSPAVGSNNPFAPGRSMRALRLASMRRDSSYKEASPSMSS